MAAGNPTTTSQLFQHDRVAAGYASVRPYLHPEVLACARELVGPASRFWRALDVGCGTGLSSVALRELADEVVGIDASLEMLRHARLVSGVCFVAADAEAPPFGDGRFDLILACGSMDWIDRPRFLPRAADLLATGGWLVSLDFGDAGRSPEMPELSRWHDEVFRQRFPRPPAADPVITSAEALAYGFEVPAFAGFASSWAFTAREYAAFLMTESNVVAVIEYGDRTADEVRASLEAYLVPIFGGQPHRVAFEGYIQALRRL